MSVIAFIIGNCEEWPEDRDTQGDIALYEHCCTFAKDVCFVKDDQACTKDSTLALLEGFLSANNDDKSRTADTLLFYYGGHGVRNGLKMSCGRRLRYSEIANKVETQFKGSKVWYFFDCCYSGAFANSLCALERNGNTTTSKSYLAVMSCHADHAANDLDWAITDCFVRASSSETIRQVLERMSDRHVLISNDWMQCKLIGDRINVNESWPFARRPDGDAEASNESSLASSLGESLSLSKPRKQVVVRDKIKWKRLLGATRGDKVYSKNHAAPIPLYEPAVLVSEVDRNDAVQVKFHSNDSIATVSLDNDVLSGFFFDYCMYEIEGAHVRMARSGRWFDASVPRGTHLFALYKGKVYGATVMQEPVWEDCGRNTIETQYANQGGPFLWLEWDQEDGGWSIVPKSHCVFGVTEKPSAKSIRDTLQVQPRLDPVDAMLKSMESQGKRLVLAGKVCPVEVLWDGERLCGELCSSVSRLAVLKQHLHFEYVRGDYYCVRLDGEKRLVPAQLLIMK